VLATLDTTTALADTDQDALDALLDGLEPADENLAELFAELHSEPEEPQEEDDPGIDLSPEVLEHQDYIVLVFDNENDWQVAAQLLDIREVAELDPKTKGTTKKTNRGMGRVIPAKRLLDKFRRE
jgi:hypothetical protein